MIRPRPSIWPGRRPQAPSSETVRIHHGIPGRRSLVRADGGGHQPDRPWLRAAVYSHADTPDHAPQQRQTWEHGCVRSITRRSRAARAASGTPAPARQTARATPAGAPQRRGDGLVDVEVTSRAGRRGIVLPNQLGTLIELHRREQEREREHAGTVWEDGGSMFAQEKRPADRPDDGPQRVETPAGRRWGPVRLAS